MHRYLPILNTILSTINREMPDAESSADADITIRLSLHKLENAILTEGIHFIAKYSDNGNVANLQLLDDLRNLRKSNQDVIDEIHRLRRDN